MVNTWHTIGRRNGTRLLYLVPGKLTDTLLPLAVDPRRTSVSASLWAVWKRSRRKIANGWCTHSPEAVRVKSRRPRRSRLSLAAPGRFAEPALQFVIGQTSNVPTRSRLEATLAEIRGVDLETLGVDPLLATIKKNP